MANKKKSCGFPTFGKAEKSAAAMHVKMHLDDALRAECEKALREHTGLKEGDEGLNGETAQSFRAGFNVLAARVEAWCWRLETEREEDFVIRQMKRDIAADLRAAIKEPKP